MQLSTHHGVLLIVWCITAHNASGIALRHLQLRGQQVARAQCSLTFCGRKGGNHLLGDYHGEGYDPRDCPRVWEDIDYALAGAELHQSLERPPLPPQSHLLLVVPHAGYAFSGSIAAQAYLEAQAAGPWDRVLLVGFYHSHRFGGALFGGLICDNSIVDTKAAAFLETALGGVQGNTTRTAVLETIRDSSPEHSLEQQMPFLSRIGALQRPHSLIPVMLGDDSLAIAETLSEAVAALLAQKEYSRKKVLMVVSSDLSHFFPASTEKKLDTDTVHQIVTLRAPALSNYFRRLEVDGGTLDMDGKQEFPCGRGGILFAAAISEKLGLSNKRVLAQSDSFHSARAPRPGSNRSVVGYAAISFSSLQAEGRIEEAPSAINSSSSACEHLSPAQLEALGWLAEREVRVQTLRTAGRHDAEAVRQAEPSQPAPGSAVLRSLLHCPHHGAFVTVYTNRSEMSPTLRGCIGCAEAGHCFGEKIDQRLPAVVTTAAYLATAHDPRFASQRLKPDELQCLSIEISVLTMPKRVKLQDVEEGDGLIVTSAAGGIHPLNQGLLLPSVWHDLAVADEAVGPLAEEGPSERLREFIRLLVTDKAKIPETSWEDLTKQFRNGSLELKRFGAQVFTSKSAAHCA